MNRREVAALACLAAATACARRVSADVIEPGDLTEPPPMPSVALDGQKALGRIGFGSCYVPQFEQGEVWNAIRRSEPDAFLFIGDNVYQSEENGRPELLELREAYAALAADPAFAALRATTPVLVTWDDHDYGMNNAGAEFPARRQSEALFKHVWAVAPGDPRRTRDGVYHSRVVGPSGRRTQLVLLDTRYFRTADTVLGEAQWRWLEQVLTADADVRIIASSIPVLTEAETGESWRAWPRDRERLFELIRKARANGVVFVSGDSHFGAFYRRDADLPYLLSELTSSSLNFPLPDSMRVPPGPSDAARHGPVFYPANFGEVTLDWNAGVLGLVLRDARGDHVRTETVDIAQLRTP